jgi:hypothetical protein
VRNPIAAIMLVAVLLAQALAPDARAAEATAVTLEDRAKSNQGAQATDAEQHQEGLAQTDHRPITYRQDSGPGFGGLLLRAAGGLVLITVLTLAITVLAKRYLPGIRGYSLDGRSRVHLLESRRITSKLTMFVIEFEGRRLLLAQSGDRVVELGAPRTVSAQGPDALETQDTA